LAVNIEEALRRERLRALVLPQPAAVPSGASLRETLQAMRAHGGGAALVCRAEKVVGIFTERDVLNKLFLGPLDDAQPVDLFMTPDPETLSLEATLGDAVRLMTEHGYRNVPLVDGDGKSAGIVAARDIVQYVAEHFPTEVANLPPSLEQVFRKREGA
jgi:CBS domain-containing protein